MSTFKAYPAGTAVTYWTAPLTRDQAAEIAGHWLPDAEYALRADMGGLCKVTNGYYGLRTPVQMTVDRDARTITV
jgi:hypothetical protein